jgi:hypothetical protein
MMRSPRAVQRRSTSSSRASFGGHTQIAEADGSPSVARAIRGVARLFADELTASDPDFDRVGFVAATTEART